MTPTFAISYVVLCLAQGVTVALPAAERFPFLARLRSRWWAAIPLAAIVGTVFGVGASAGTADVLTYLALVTTPPLAAIALAHSARGARPALALLVLPLAAIAWIDRGTLLGESASLILVAAACVTLATLLAAIAPELWLKIGLLLMAAADTWLVSAQLLQHPNAVLDAAAPGGGLPQFQRIVFGGAAMGYGDLFAAALLGAILAKRRREQTHGALLTTALAVAFGLCFFAVDTLPATLPIAVALIVLELRGHRRAARRAVVRSGAR